MKPAWPGRLRAAALGQAGSPFAPSWSPSLSSCVWWFDLGGHTPLPRGCSGVLRLSHVPGSQTSKTEPLGSDRAGPSGFLARVPGAALVGAGQRALMALPLPSTLCVQPRCPTMTFHTWQPGSSPSSRRWGCPVMGVGMGGQPWVGADGGRQPRTGVVGEFGGERGP